MDLLVGLVALAMAITGHCQVFNNIKKFVFFYLLTKYTRGALFWGIIAKSRKIAKFSSHTWSMLNVRKMVQCVRFSNYEWRTCLLYKSDAADE